jgi:hypothetical protein
MLGGDSVECGLVRLSCGLWNDHRNDHLSKHRGPPAVQHRPFGSVRIATLTPPARDGDRHCVELRLPRSTRTVSGQPLTAAADSPFGRNAARFRRLRTVSGWSGSKASLADDQSPRMEGPGAVEVTLVAQDGGEVVEALMAVSWWSGPRWVCWMARTRSCRAREPYRSPWTPRTRARLPGRAAKTSLVGS